MATVVVMVVAKVAVMVAATVVVIVATVVVAEPRPRGSVRCSR
jgi:hypothetical protein